MASSEGASSEGARERGAELPRVPGYRIEGILGRGATGIVYKATQVAVDRPVALKILRADLVGTRRAVRRLQREARTAARLAHPSIISSIDMGEVDGLWWYAMELVEGQSLSSRIEDKGSLSEREALRVFIPLCDALQHAYEGGVVHRDIKPANILIDTNGRARLVDLGLAFAEDDPMLTKPGGTLGTPHFISPEQARDPSSADTRSDIWSLGATLFQALCGRPPFQGESVAEILSSVLYQRIPDPRQLAPGLSRGIALVVRKCLTRDPNRRYQQPAELLRDLERLRERRQPAIRAGTLDPVARSEQAWRDPKVLAVGLSSALLLIVVLGRFFGLFGENAVGAPTKEFAPDSWPELQHVARNFESGRTLHRGALLELDEMRVPEVFELEVSELRTRVLTALDATLADWRREVDAGIRVHLEGHEWEKGRRAVAADAYRRLEDLTGFGRVMDLPAGRRGQQERWRSELEARLNQRFDAAWKLAEEALEGEYEAKVRPRVRELGEQRRWRDALELVNGSPLRWLEDSGADLRGFEVLDLREIEASIDVQRNADRTDLRSGWLQVRGRLNQWIDQTEEALRERLDRGDERRVAGALREAFDRRLVQQGIERDQVPDTWDMGPFRRVERAAGDLAQREARLVEGFAQRSYEEDLAFTTQLCRRRSYAAALRRWQAREGDPLFESLGQAVRLRMHECELLLEVLDRAALAVRAREGGEFECYDGNILERGTIEAAADPVGRGFELETRRRMLRVFLAGPPAGSMGRDPELAGVPVVLLTADLELLAGLGGSTLSTADRLLRALFRYYEGDLAEADAALPVSLLGSDALADDLAERIRTELESKTERERARGRDLEDSLRSIKWKSDRAESPVEARRLSAEIARLFETSSDILSAGDREDLKRLQLKMTRLAADPLIEDVFGPFAPKDLVFTSAQGVDMRFRFDAEAPGSWKRGGWTKDDGGWVLPEALGAAEQLHERSKSVRLDLAPPFDFRERIELTLTLGPVYTAGLENVIAVSIVGYHIVLLDEPSNPRVVVGTGSLPSVIETVSQGDSAGFGSFAALPRDREYELEIVLSPSGGKLEAVRLDGDDLTVRSLYKKPAVPPREIVVRSMEPVRLVEARVRGRRTR